MSDKPPNAPPEHQQRQAPELGRTPMITFFKRNDELTQALCVVGVTGAGLLAGWVSPVDVRDWYPLLNKPPQTPPNWAFGVAWTLLYVLMGYSLARVLMKTLPDNREIERRRALRAFALMLPATFAWNPLFFKLHLLWLSAAWIYLVLWLSTWTLLAVYKIDSKATAALVPLLGWLFFACYLMTWIYLYN